MGLFDDPQESPEKGKENALLDENSGTDRISTLPLSVLSHILSFLPTEDAVATSLLSTQWKKFFPLICNLSVTFSEDSWVSRRSGSSFVDFVNQVLNVTYRDMPRIDTVNFFCSQQTHYHDWIRSAVRLNVQTLGIDHWNFPHKSPVMLLYSLIDCKTLKNLTLGRDFVLHVPEGGITFPNLRTLSLQWIEFVDENSIQGLLNGCPRLEYLTLHFALLQKGLRLHICLCSLKSLDLNIPSRNFKTILDIPRLESLKYCGTLDSIHPVKKLDVLQRADILFYLDKTGSQRCPTDLTKFIAACSNVNQLKLRIRNAHQLPTYYSHVLPELPSLINLQLGVPHVRGWELLADFFLKAPNLKSLCISKRAAKIPYETFLCAMPELLPTCLNEIEFDVLDWDEGVLKVIQYFLENANLLQKIRIGFRTPKKQAVLLWKLQEMGWWWKFRKLSTHSNMRQMLWKNLLLDRTWTRLI